MNESSATVSVSNPLLRSAWADWAGMIASIGCAIHCAAMPLVLAYLPTLGLGWLAGEGFHQWMAVICFGLAAAAFVPGWRKHGSIIPAMWGAAGLFLLTSAAFGLEGSCCPSCAPGDTSTEVTSTENIATANDDGCAFCESCETTEETTKVASSSALAPFAGFITPFGGVLLVVGHIANHLKSCKCRGNNCCLDQPSNANKIVSLD